MIDKKNYSIDVIVQAVARLFGGVLSFLAIYILTYLFDEAVLGIYNIVLSTVNIIASLGTLWLSQSILRFYDEKSDLGAVIILVIVSVLLSVFTFAVYSLISIHEISIWAYAYVVMLVLYNVFDAVFRRSRKLKSYVLMELLLSFSRVFPMYLFGILTKDYNSIFSSQCVLLFLYFLILLIKSINKLKYTSYKVSGNMLKQYLKFGVPLMGLAISNWFLTTSDRYIINFFGDDAQVGIYSTNYSLANSIYMMFSLIIINAFHPIIMKEWEKNKDNVLNLVSHTIDLYLMLMVPLTFYGCIKAKVLLSMFKGDVYASHSDVFIWTSLGIFFYGLSLLFHKYYELIKKTNIILAINVISALTNILLNLIMIPIFGFGIAAFTTFLSYIVYIIIVRALSFRKFKLKISIRKLIIVIGSTLIFYIIDYFFIHSDNILIFFIEGLIFVAYTVVVYQLLKVINLKDIKIIK